MNIPVDELRALIEKILSSKYYTPEEASKIADVFLYAELSGKDTQGLLKLMGTEPAQSIQPRHAPKIEEKTKISALVDGGGAAGPLPAQIATEKVIELAQENGFGIVGVRNTFSSVGAISYYARKLAQHDLIGIVAANSPRSVVHWGGLDLAYGTNPIAFGFPTEEYPIVFDMATSAITWYGLVRAKALGQKLPDNVAVDKDGNITTDPEEAMTGAILPFDRSYKGSGLGMVVELLGGVLPGASYVFDEGEWGTTIMAISPNLLGDVASFKKHSSDLVRKVKSGRRKEGEDIHIAGYDREKEMEKILQSGEIDIEETLLKALRQLV